MSIIKKIIKKIFKNNKNINQLINNIELFVSRVFSASVLTSSLYYGLNWQVFGREHRAVLYGKRKYFQEIKEHKKTQYLLRRNIHRIEKGMVMCPRRDIFATDFIEETVEIYESVFKASEGNIGAETELKWSYDVLKEYFNIVDVHPIINKAKSRFIAIQNGNIVNNSQYIPYKRNLETPPPVEYESLLKLSKRRRSVRWYLPKAVPRELIDKAISVAALSPSACNRQPYEFRIFDQPALVKKVASIPMGTAGYYDNIPVIVVIIGKLRAYFSERDRHLIYIDSSLAAMSFMYALETMGLSSCSINWPDIHKKERKIKNILGLDPDERPIMMISLGYPDPGKLVCYSQKKPLSLLRKYNS
jgi:nitroreductase